MKRIRGILRARVALWLHDDTAWASSVASAQQVPVTPRRRIWFGSVLALVGLALLSRLFMVTDRAAVREALLATGPAALLVFAAPAVGQLVHMLAWRNLLPAPLRPPLGRAYRIFLAAQAGNEIGVAFLGEPLKIVAFAPGDRRRATRAVIEDNGTSAVALVVFFAILGALAARPGASGPLVAAGAVVIVAASATAVVARSALRRTVVTTLLHLVGKLWLLVELALVTSLFGPISLHQVAVLAVASAGAATLGAAMPAQLGVTEAALVSAGGAVGIAAPTALAIAILRRLRGGLWILAGAIAWPGASST